MLKAEADILAAVSEGERRELEYILSKLELATRADAGGHDDDAH